MKMAKTEFRVALVVSGAIALMEGYKLKGYGLMLYP